ncbi:MAG: hypothetical protein ACRCXX_13775 [Cetobacterium sp.]|uniref:hypothetical protein n=1 Tax=Cetobacterium sp. TaxID=2071632 RepID=UPI003F30E5FB
MTIKTFYRSFAGNIMFASFLFCEGILSTMIGVVRILPKIEGGVQVKDSNGEFQIVFNSLKIEKLGSSMSDLHSILKRISPLGECVVDLFDFTLETILLDEISVHVNHKEQLEKRLYEYVDEIEKKVSYLSKDVSQCLLY